MKIFMAMLIKAGTWAIMKYLRGLSKGFFDGKLAEDVVAKYVKNRSVTAPLPPKL